LLGLWLGGWVAACGPQDEPPPVSERTVAEMTAPGPFGVGVATFTFTDTSRVRPANGAEPEAPQRELVTEVWYPAVEGSPGAPARDAAVDLSGGPQPLLVHSHGFMSSRTHHPGLASFLASHGYVFAAPDFPLSGLGAPGGPTVLDLGQQPGDVSHVIDSLLELNAAPDHAFEGLIDADRIGLSGLSLGGLTTLLAGLFPDLRDGRADLLIPMAAPSCWLPVRSFDEATLPMMVLHGDSDALVPFEAHAQPLYDHADAPKILARFVAGTHTGFPDFSAALFDNLEHADSIGCEAIEGSIDEGGSTSGLFPGEELLNADCALPCASGQLGVGMKPSRQVLLTLAVVRAYLDARFRGDSEAALFLSNGIAVRESDIQLMVQ
jgi:predicted dienelactone hydrolase